MSIAESYIRATKSSHLEVTVSVGDVDYLIAAGLVRESLATRLIRLSSEFDAISAVTEARVLLPMLRGMLEAKQFLLAHALAEAGNRWPGADLDSIVETTAKVLDHFLDPNCPACTGRGYSGSYGAPQIRCSACRETGKRYPYWKTQDQEHFARWLQGSIEAKIDRCLHEMRRLLRDRPATIENRLLTGRV